MLQKLFSIRVVTKEDMARLEEVVVGLLGGEHHRCSFLRSDEFVKLRNYALYCTNKTSTRSVHVEGLKIVLLSTGKACVYLTDPCVVPLSQADAVEQHDINDETTLVGKKRRAVVLATPCDQEGGGGASDNDNDDDNGGYDDDPKG
jgi:hypothetical protein